MKKRGKIIIRVILILILVAGLVLLGLYELEEYSNSKGYEAVREIASSAQEAPKEQPAEKPAEEALPLPQEEETEEVEQTEEEETLLAIEQVESNEKVLEDPAMEYLLPIELEPLQEENEEVIGWIYVPGTDIDYPILQGSDNEFYLDHGWDLSSKYAGSIFLESQNSADFTDFNTIVYGHNMRSGSMFGSLKQYSSSSYLEDHQYIYIATETGLYRYDVFAAHRVQTNNVVYMTKIDEPKQREQFIDFALDYTSVKTDIVPTADDQILTLSTCSGGNDEIRWVVQAVLRPEASYKKP
ncbi:MAG: class B sortase [Oscillospiraceae bacterium]|nr:class B sortase [Oscillospiraceae bacterium]